MGGPQQGPDRGAPERIGEDRPDHRLGGLPSRHAVRVSPGDRPNGGTVDRQHANIPPPWRLDAVRATSGALRATLDGLVLTGSAAAALVSGGAGAPGWWALLRVAVVAGLYGLLIPFRHLLLRSLLRVLMRAALR